MKVISALAPVIYQWTQITMMAYAHIRTSTSNTVLPRNGIRFDVSSMLLMGF